MPASEKKERGGGGHPKRGRGRGKAGACRDTAAHIKARKKAHGKGKRTPADEKKKEKSLVGLISEDAQRKSKLRGVPI